MNNINMGSGSKGTKRTKQNIFTYLKDALTMGKKEAIVTLIISVIFLSIGIAINYKGNDETVELSTVIMGILMWFAAPNIPWIIRFLKGNPLLSPYVFFFWEDKTVRGAVGITIVLYFIIGILMLIILGVPLSVIKNIAAINSLIKIKKHSSAV